jgi:glutamyl-tRNA reductase
MADIVAISAQARHVPAHERERFAQVAGALAQQTVVLTTCHRVELYGEQRELAAMPTEALPIGARFLDGDQAVRHIVRLAVGLESAVVAEDQVLHQLRRAVQSARSRSPLPTSLDRAVDAALRAGRLARTWLPRRRDLAELALSRLGERAVWQSPVLIVGAGDMGRRAARAVAARGLPLSVTSRTPERAAVLAAEVGARTLPFDPGAIELRRFSGVVVALAGPWVLSAASSAALEETSWVIDLSAPTALQRHTVERLAERLTTIDDLAQRSEPDLSPRLLRRLETLVDETVAQHRHWLEHEAQRRLAQALADRAHDAQTTELMSLWQRVPGFEPAQRAEIERMARRLAERLIREPLEQLDRDREGDHAQAAKSLFRL